MLFPIRQLIEGHGTPLCVTKSTKLRDALALMMEHDYSQLPIIDMDGNLTGIITEQSIISTYFHSRSIISLLDISVDHCQTTPNTISPESDIFDALDVLKNVYSIVVVQDKKPVGIVTDYDTTQFFQNISGGLILVEDIEVTLRQYIENILSDKQALKAALIKAFGHDKRTPTEPAQEYDELTLGGYINMIMADHNWEKFDAYFKPKQLFFELLNQVRQIRNQLSHFRGRLKPVQHDALIRARDWLSSRPKVAIPLEIQSIEHIHVTDSPSLQTSEKFLPIYNWLVETKRNHSNLNVTIGELEEVISEQLPSSARTHRSWWDNDHLSNPHSLAWLRAGWRVKDVDLAKEEIYFQKTNQVLMQLYFADLLERLKSARPGLTNATKTFSQNWWSFGAGKSGFSFGWVFTGHGTLRVELYIDTGKKTDNKTYFDLFMAYKDDIEKEMGFPLAWERLDSKRASRIFVEIQLRISDTKQKLDDAEQWALTTMLQFVDILQPRIREL